VGVGGSYQRHTPLLTDASQLVYFIAPHLKKKSVFEFIFS
jgi:hypothetical protein